MPWIQAERFPVFGNAGAFAGICAVKRERKIVMRPHRTRRDRDRFAQHAERQVPLLALSVRDTEFDQDVGIEGLEFPGLVQFENLRRPKPVFAVLERFLVVCPRLRILNGGSVVGVQAGDPRERHQRGSPQQHSVILRSSRGYFNRLEAVQNRLHSRNRTTKTLTCLPARSNLLPLRYGLEASLPSRKLDIYEVYEV